MNELVKISDVIKAVNSLESYLLIEPSGKVSGSGHKSAEVMQALKTLQTIDQPEVVYCKDCEKHNKDIGDYKEDGKTFIWKPDACPLIQWRGKSQGHEHDYQFCAYAERRTDE